MPRGEVILIAGDAGAGKSWLGVRMAAEIAAGVSVLGQPARQKQIVLYCLTQGKAGFARRLHAHLELLKIDPKDENNGVRVRDNLPHLIDPQGYGVKASGGLAWFLVISADQHRGKLPKQIDVLFLDYLREASQGAIENSNDDMALVMAAANQLARALNVGIVLFHHQGTNTDKAGRGATVVRDMCYAMLLLIGEVDKGAVEPARLTCDKAPKDHKKLAPICLTLDLTNPGYPVLVYTDEKQVGKATANAIYELLKRLKGQRLSLGDLERELPQPEGISDTAWQARIKRACHAIRDDAVGFPGVDYQERKGLCYATKGAAIAVPYAE